MCSEVSFAEIGGARLSREQVTVSVEGMGKGKISRLTFGEAQKGD